VTRNDDDNNNNSNDDDERVTVLWNQGAQTDREILANRPDIIKNKEYRFCLLIDVGIPSDRNVA
jgi:hypothetical protein